MLSHPSDGPVRPWTWQRIRQFQIALWGITLLCPALIFRGLYNNHRDRQSLQWPNVPGTMIRSEAEYVGPKSGYHVMVSYSYRVNGRGYMGNLINLWEPNGAMENKAEAEATIEAYVPKSTVRVYYNPQHPEIAVLEPGADDVRNRALMWMGGLFAASFGFLTIRTNNFFNRMIAWRIANPPKMPAKRKEKVGSLPHGFVSYEPGCKRKLNCFECRDELDQFLGDEDEKALQAWKPDDRIIDVNGQEYRLVPNTKKTRYGMEPTSEIWTWEKLLDVALADARLLKKDTDALRRSVTDAPVEKRIPVLMKGIEDLSSGPSWAMAVFILFLVAFFFAVFFGITWLFPLLGKLVHGWFMS